MDDGELLTGMKANDQAALQVLFEKYARYAAAVAVRASGMRLTAQDVEEICSDVFYTLWNKRASLTLSGGTLKPYIGTLAKNRALNALRGRGEWAGSQLYDAVGAAPSSEECYLLQEDWETLSRAIAAVDEPDREFFIRRYLYQERVKDIADDKGMNVKTVSGRISKARKRVALLIEKLGGWG